MTMVTTGEDNDFFRQFENQRKVKKSEIRNEQTSDFYFFVYSPISLISSGIRLFICGLVNCASAPTDSPFLYI